MISRIFLIGFIILFASSVLKSQEPHDCSHEDCYHGFVISKPFSADPDTVIIDTTTTEFYKADIFSSEVFFPASTGTTGHAAVDLFRRFRAQGFDYFYHNPYENYQLTPENLRIIRSDIPYSEWYYLVGSHSEQIFRATHAQDAGKNLNFGLDLKYINSKGAYFHEHARSSYMGFYGQYRDPVLPFESDLAVFFNSAITEENGGISEPEWFEDNEFINRELIPVWSTSAQNKHRGTGVLLTNRWYPGGKKATRRGADTGENSDTLELTKAFSALQHHFSLTFGLNRGWFLYQDPDPLNSWYDQVRFDSVMTDDSVSFKTFSIDIAYHLAAWQRVNVTAGINFGGYRTYDTLVPDGRGTMMEPYTRWKFMIFPSLCLNAGASLRIDGEMGAAHSIDAKLLWRLGDIVDLKINIRDWTEYPFIQDIRYSSNHFYWSNEMKNQHFTQLNPVLRIRWKLPVQIEGVATLINRMIYYNNYAMPNQYFGSVTLWQMVVSSEWASRRFSFNGRIAFQRSSDEYILRQPDILGELMGGYEFSLFGGKIRATGGLILKGTTGAYLDEYMPSTRVFYHTVRAPVKSYVWADPFLTFLLKKTRFMLKYEHASAWIAGFGQYSLPGYPMADPALKFAIAWRFMD